MRVSNRPKLATNACVKAGQWDFLDEELFPYFGASRGSCRNPLVGDLCLELSRRGNEHSRVHAMILGIVFSLVIGCGLMALMFYSSRHGYDEPPDCR